MPSILLNGPSGRLEGHYTQYKAPITHSFNFACPPGHGGNMNNPLSLNYKFFSDLGFSTLDLTLGV